MNEQSNRYGAGGRGFKPVPSKRSKRGEQPLERALADFVSALAKTDAPWMIIGGIAVIARGVRRMTTDIDAVVRGDAINARALLKALAKKGITPRIDNAEAFAQESLVLLLRHDRTGVNFDLSLGWTAFEFEALEARSDVRYGSVVAPMARAEDLVIYKAMAARATDIEDATALLLMHDDIDLARVRKRLRELATVVDEPQLVTGLEAVIARSESAKKKAKSSTRTRARKR